MRFNIIIGNPPYQEQTGTTSAQAKPIYNKFIEMAKELNPKYISMIIPSRWMTGGMGLKEFRKNMLNDKKLSKIIDFNNATECFPSVDIKGGVNYFLWDIDHSGLCEYENKKQNRKININLNKYDVLIRDPIGLDLVKKIEKIENVFFDKKVGSIGEFGIPSNFKDYKDNKFNNSIKLYGNKQNMKETNGIGFISKKYFKDKNKNLQKHKVLVSKASGSGNDKMVLSQIIYAEPNSICSFTYIVLNSFDNKEEAENLIKYIQSKFFRYLVSLTKNTQNVSKKVFSFVPDLPMTEEWTDEKLYKRYNLTKDEISYIEENIKKMKKI